LDGDVTATVWYMPVAAALGRTLCNNTALDDELIAKSLVYAVEGIEDEAVDLNSGC